MSIRLLRCRRIAACLVQFRQSVIRPAVGWRSAERALELSLCLTVAAGLQRRCSDRLNPPPLADIRFALHVSALGCKATVTDSVKSEWYTNLVPGAWFWFAPLQRNGTRSPSRKVGASASSMSANDQSGHCPSSGHTLRLALGCHHRLTITTSRYSAGTTMVPSVARLNVAIRVKSSAVRDCCSSARSNA
jgi:hypothetical protein